MRRDVRWRPGKLLQPDDCQGCLEPAARPLRTPQSVLYDNQAPARCMGWQMRMCCPPASWAAHSLTTAGCEVFCNTAARRRPSDRPTQQLLATAHMAEIPMPMSWRGTTQSLLWCVRVLTRRGFRTRAHTKRRRERGKPCLTDLPPRRAAGSSLSTSMQARPDMAQGDASRSPAPARACHAAGSAPGGRACSRPTRNHQGCRSWPSDGLICA